MKLLKWKPSNEGYTETHCGSFHISPVYWGRCNATGYKLTRGKEYRGHEYDTQRQAKEAAQALADRDASGTAGSPQPGGS